MIIDVALGEHEVLVRPRGAAPTLEGGTWNRERRLYSFPPRIDRVLPALLRCQKAGDEVLGTPELQEWVNKSLEEMKRRKNEVLARIETLKSKGLPLFPFQEIGAAYLAERTGALLADMPGLGKTVQGLTAIPKGLPALVVAPAVAKGVWETEAKRFRPDLSTRLLSGKNHFLWPKPGEMVIVNPDILPSVRFRLEAKSKRGQYTKGGVFDHPDECWTEAIAKHPKASLEELKKALKITVAADEGMEIPHEGTVLLIDEAHLYIHSTSLRTRKMGLFADMIRLGHGTVWGLTGTPLLKLPPELYTLLSILDCAAEVFDSWHGFVKCFHGKRSRFGMVWGDPEPDVRARLERVMLRREREEVLPDLPTKTFRTLDVPLTKSLEKECQEALEKLQALGVNFEDLAEFVRATQEDPVMFETMTQLRKALAVAKTPFCHELSASYEAQKEPLIVFSAHRDPVLSLGARKGWKAIVGGDVSSEERKEIEVEFQAGKIKGLALTIQAGGVALTLTRACHVVFLDRLYIPALNEQAEDRACRITQTRGVIITLLVGAHPLDKHIQKLLSRRERLIDRTLKKSS